MLKLVTQVIKVRTPIDEPLDWIFQFDLIEKDKTRTERHYTFVYNDIMWCNLNEMDFDRESGYIGQYVRFKQKRLEVPLIAIPTLLVPYQPRAS